MNALKASIQSFIDSLHMYDYIFIGISGALFLLLLVLAIVLRTKTVLSLILVLLSFIILVAGPLFGYQYIHSTIYKNEISELKIKALEFSEAVVIKGKLTNLGQQAYTKCTISSKAYAGADGFFAELINPLKPFVQMSILKTELLDMNESLEFKMILEPFTYSSEYNISVKAECL